MRGSKLSQIILIWITSSKKNESSSLLYPYIWKGTSTLPPSLPPEKNNTLLVMYGAASSYFSRSVVITVSSYGSYPYFYFDIV